VRVRAKSLIVRLKFKQRHAPVCHALELPLLEDVEGSRGFALPVERLALVDAHLCYTSAERDQLSPLDRAKKRHALKPLNQRGWRDGRILE